MDFEAWTNPSVDRLRQKRLFVGGVVGALTILSTFAALAMTQKGVSEEVPEEEVVEVELAKEPEPEPEPEAQPEPEPEPEPASAPRAAGPVMPQITTPTEIPSDAPSEKPTDSTDNPYASGDPFMYASGAGGVARTGSTVVKAEAAKPVEAPKPSGPMRVDANVTPPTPLSALPAQEYPAEAKAAGVEGPVYVKFTVTETGDVTDLRAIRGPELLRASCVNKFKGMKYSPAIFEGKPVSVQQTKTCKFTLN